MRFSASLAAFLDFEIQNDRNTRSFEGKFNMHISEIVKSTGEGRRPGLYKRWRPLGVELALFRISGCFCDFQIQNDRNTRSYQQKSTSIPKICPIPPHFEISNGFPLGPGSLTATPSGYLAKAVFLISGACADHPKNAIYSKMQIHSSKCLKYTGISALFSMRIAEIVKWTGKGGPAWFI